MSAWVWLTLVGGAVLVVVVAVVAVRAYFDRLRSGMTEAQVRAIMGEPAAVDEYAGGPAGKLCRGAELRTGRGVAAAEVRFTCRSHP
jgi:hypothetical protein